MKLRDNLTVFTVTVAAVSLEAGLLGLYWAGKDAQAPPFNTVAFLVAGQVFVLAACAAAYGASRLLLRPVEAILEGIAQFEQGRFTHRIPGSRIREVGLVAEQLNAMAAKLGEVEGLKSEFVANASHELRSPLAAMEQYAGLLLESPGLSQQGKDNLARISENLGRLRRMVENLLEMSRIEDGRLAARAETFDVAEAVADVCALQAPRIAAAGLTLENKVGSSAPSVRADRDLLRQILTNLIDNAVKYNRRGGSVTVEAAAGEGAVKITVRDTGYGIKAEHMDKLFLRFSRLPAASPDAPKAKGAGLGLAISRGLARAMGGELTAESAAGQGSAFICVLPLAEKD